VSGHLRRRTQLQSEDTQGTGPGKSLRDLSLAVSALTRAGCCKLMGRNSLVQGTRF
jgi:hypothetical protein